MDADRVEGELARIREMEKRVEKLDAEVSSAVQSAEIDMQKTREALKQMHGGDSPRDSAKSRLDREAENVKALHEEAQQLRENGADADSVKRAELAYAAAQENLLKREKEHEAEAEAERARMSNIHQKQRDRMLVKLQKKRLQAERLRQERERAEKIKEMQAKEEVERKKAELQRQGQLNEARVKEIQSEAEAAMVMHQSNIDAQTEKRRARIEKRLQAKRAQKKLALKRKQDEEQARELAAQEEERKKLESMSSREREMRMLEGIMIRGAVSYFFTSLYSYTISC